MGVIPEPASRAEPGQGPPDVTVVIVTYGRPDLVERCLSSVGHGTRSLRLEIVVVDNHGKDGTRELVAREFPHVRYVDPGANLGFGRACNLGASTGAGRYILLLNPDAEVHPGCIDRLVEFDARHPEVGIVGGRTLGSDGRPHPDSCGGSMSMWSLVCFASGLSWAFKGSRLLDPTSLGRWDRDDAREVGVVYGCLLLASRTTWDRLGGFDEAFFMYSEDDDLCGRARQLGLRPSITPDAVITHVLGASSSTPANRVVLRSAGAVTLIRKRWSGIRGWLAFGLFVTGVRLRAVLWGSAAKVAWAPTEASAYWPAVWDRRKEWMTPEWSPGVDPRRSPRPSGIDS